MNMMRFGYRLTVLVLVAALIIATYLAGIPHKAKDWYYKDTEMKLSGKAFVTKSPDYMLAKHVQIDKEWENFIHLSQKAKHEVKLQNFTLKVNAYEEDIERSQRISKTEGNVTQTKSKKYSKKKKVRKKKEQCIILIYTYLHKSREWYNLPFNSTKDYLKRTDCKYQNCVVTYDKDYLRLADVVVFHARNLPSIHVLDQISTKFYRPKKQRWVYFTSETPKNSAFGAIPYNGLFNWTMTYKADSDVYLPYLQYRKLKPNDPRPDPDINYAENRTKIAAWLVGNCNFEFRINFAHLLAQFTEVSVGGGCRDQFKKKIDCTRWCDFSPLQAFKFYLSFENGVCTDYITEKYWQYLEMGLVPVVLGGANYSNPKLAIPGSFIDASSFKSVKELGLYLNYLDRNDAAYNEYFKWKQKYRIWHPPKGDWPFESYFLCKLCEMVNKDLPDKIYDNLSEFWNEYIDCEIPEQTLQKKFIPNGFGTDSRERDSEEERRIKNAQISKDFDEDF